VGFSSVVPELPTERALAPVTPPVLHCYLRDVLTGRTAWISARSDGGISTEAAGVGGCATAQVSADGRRVAFLADGALDLQDPPPNPVPNAYAREVSEALVAGPVRRLHLEVRNPLDRSSLAIRMSRDGLRFAVQTRARLLPGSDNADYDAYLFTENPPEVSAITVTNAGTFPPLAGECGGNNELSAFSGDGNFIGFHGPRSYAPDDTDQRRDSYLRSLTAHTTELLSGRRSAARPSGPCSYRGAGGLALSYDARYALFYSDNARLDDTLERDDWDFFLRDRAFPLEDARGLTRLHLGPLARPEALGVNDLAGLSDDGRLAAVVSYRRLDRPDVMDVGATRHLFVLDLTDPAEPLRDARLVDVDAAGDPSDQATLPFEAVLAGDGSAVAFVSNTPLVPEDGNTHPDVYLRVLR
jgi:hypothetical protein